jgi:hypothetical protein
MAVELAVIAVIFEGVPVRVDGEGEEGILGRKGGTEVFPGVLDRTSDTPGVISGIPGVISDMPGVSGRFGESVPSGRGESSRELDAKIIKICCNEEHFILYLCHT